MSAKSVSVKSMGRLKSEEQEEKGKVEEDDSIEEKERRANLLGRRREYCGGRRGLEGNVLLYRDKDQACAPLLPEPSPIFDLNRQGVPRVARRDSRGSLRLSFVQGVKTQLVLASSSHSMSS